MTEREILNRLMLEYKKILKENLTGIYVHGSIAFGCFNPNKSDIDFLTVTKSTPTIKEKKKLINVLLESDSPPKGFEMSVVLEKYCRDFVYPTPYELHFSNAHRASCGQNLEKYCMESNGADKDLAAHFTVIRETGITLCGEDIKSVFQPVPAAAYLDSIKCDIENAEYEIGTNPIYIILNLCRVLAYIEDGAVLSKAQGGRWGRAHLPDVYTGIVEAAERCYESSGEFFGDRKALREFAKYMLNRIK